MSRKRKLIKKVVGDQIKAIELYKSGKELPSSKDQELREDWAVILKLGLRDTIHQAVASKLAAKN